MPTSLEKVVFLSTITSKLLMRNTLSYIELRFMKVHQLVCERTDSQILLRDQKNSEPNCEFELTQVFEGSN